MKEFLSKPENIRRIEFWAVTTIYIFVIFIFITEATEYGHNAYAPNKDFFDKAGIKFSYTNNYFFPILFRISFLYALFLVMNFTVAPRIIQRRNIGRLVFFIIALLFLSITVLGVLDTYTKNYILNSFATEYEGYKFIFTRNIIVALWLLLCFAFYTLIKRMGIYILVNAEDIKKKYSFVDHAGLVTFVLWMFSMFLLLILEGETELFMFWGILAPMGIGIYWFSQKTLIPTALVKKRPLIHYLFRVLIISVISFLPIVLFCLLVTNNDEAPFVAATFNGFFHLLITAPVSWIVFKRRMKGNEEVIFLKKELGQSNANIDFLRSQINPHFLFNALNTIYGTAIQEKAERTSEGIEKLGDMMRFMLQENIQEKISLIRELDYLNNYISLQKLRTVGNENVRIESNIPEAEGKITISPMLLIPFVENAFKHGISFREPSHINVALELRDNKLFFDVYNSKHLKNENDPEKFKSGIGLKNVQQRLHLLYPKKHELVIRETAKEFFVHLTIEL